MGDCTQQGFAGFCFVSCFWWGGEATEMLLGSMWIGEASPGPWLQRIRNWAYSPLPAPFLGNLEKQKSVDLGVDTAAREACDTGWGWNWGGRRTVEAVKREFHEESGQ